MSLPILALAFLVFLVAAYRLYGRWVAGHFRPDDSSPTPAHKQADGVDFVPTKPFYLFAQHFSAIAAAGPIAGPILASQTWGWLPCLLWISLGVVLIGAVHDFSSLTASVRHGACSIASHHARAPRAPRRPRDDDLHLDRASLRGRGVRRHHGGELRQPHRGARRDGRDVRPRRGGCRRGGDVPRPRGRDGPRPAVPRTPRSGLSR